MKNTILHGFLILSLLNPYAVDASTPSGEGSRVLNMVALDRNLEIKFWKALEEVQGGNLIPSVIARIDKKIEIYESEREGFRKILLDAEEQMGHSRFVRNASVTTAIVLPVAVFTLGTGLVVTGTAAKFGVSGAFLLGSGSSAIIGSYTTLYVYTDGFANDLTVRPENVEQLIEKLPEIIVKSGDVSEEALKQRWTYEAQFRADHDKYLSGWNLFGWDAARRDETMVAWLRYLIEWDTAVINELKQKKEAVLAFRDIQNKLK